MWRELRVRELSLAVVVTMTRRFHYVSGRELAEISGGGGGG
jgi:hypothetical protein